jgi:hypothetical protein
MARAGMPLCVAIGVPAPRSAHARIPQPQRVTSRHPRADRHSPRRSDSHERGHAARSVTPHDPYRSPCRAGRGGGRKQRRRVYPAAHGASHPRPGARPVHRARPERPDAATAADPRRHRDLGAPARLARCECQSGTDRLGHGCPAGTSRPRDRHDPHPCAGRRRAGRRRPERPRDGAEGRAGCRGAGTRVIAAAGPGDLDPAGARRHRGTSPGDVRAAGARHPRGTGTRDLHSAGTADDRATGTGDVAATGTRDVAATGAGHATGATTVRAS